MTTRMGFLRSVNAVYRAYRERKGKGKGGNKGDSMKEDYFTVNELAEKFGKLGHIEV